MRKNLILLYLTSFFLLISSTLRVNMVYAQKKQITLEDIWLDGTFRAASVPGFRVMNDGKRYVQLEPNGAINAYDLKTGVLKTSILNPELLALPDGDTIKISDIAFSADEQKLLLFTKPESIYRRSTLYLVYVYDSKTKSINILDDEKVLHADFAPDASKVAFVKGNNLYYKDLSSGSLVQVTKDGEKNKIIYGNCDWVYEEEFSFTKAYQWSPKGNYIAFYRFDESRVKEYTMMMDRGKNYPEPYTFKYPKAGEDNSIVSIHILDVRQNKVMPADIGAETDQYIPRIKWSNNDDRLCITRLNRKQNHLELLLVDAQSGKSELIYEEQNKYYIDITDDLTFLPDNQSLMISSERDGYNHLYKWNWKTKSLTQLTKGTNEIKEVLGADLAQNKVYYVGIEDVVNTGFYVLDLKTLRIQRLSHRVGTHHITAFTGYKYFLENYSSLNQVPQLRIIDNKGKQVRLLADNKALEQKMSEYNFVMPQFFTVANSEGINLNAYMIKPYDFDSTKRYPVLMYQYSGPGSQQVLNRFNLDNYWWHQYMAQLGYIIVVADGTGTGGRGEEFKKKTYLQLGNLESRDQITVAQFLRRQPYVDSNRVGIWGWSYGGFMSTTCILKAPDVFKAAIAVAPVTSWRFYDNIYTERFMRTPQENPSGYDANAPLKMAKNLKGKYLLVHGTADDNVHLHNATEMSKALVDANKEFDAFYYTNKNHGISGGYTRYHLYKKMTKFILDNL